MEKMPEKDDLTLAHRYVAGQMEHPEKLEFEQRLVQEPLLAALTSEISAIWQASQHYRSPDFDASQALTDFDRRRRIADRRRWVMRAAALILVLVTAGIVLYQNQNPDLRDLYANSAIERQFDDGSKIALRSGAHVRIPETFGKKRQVEMVSGEVFFDVAPESNKPFVVKHPWADVRVVGTSFMIGVDSAEQTYLLVVAEGTVLFIPNLSREEIAVNAGNGVKFHANTRIIEPIRANETNVLSWQTGVLRFVDTPVDEVIADLIDHYEVEISLVDSRAGQCRFTAPLPYQKVPVTDILKALATTFSMTLITEEEGKYILKGGKCER